MIKTLSTIICDGCGKAKDPEENWFPLLYFRQAQLKNGELIHAHVSLGDSCSKNCVMVNLAKRWPALVEVEEDD